MSIEAIVPIVTAFESNNVRTLLLPKVIPFEMLAKEEALGNLEVFGLYLLILVVEDVHLHFLSFIDAYATRELV